MSDFAINYSSYFPEPFFEWRRERVFQFAFALSLIVHGLLIAFVPAMRSVNIEAPAVLNVELQTPLADTPRRIVKPATEPMPKAPVERVTQEAEPPLSPVTPVPEPLPPLITQDVRRLEPVRVDQAKLTPRAVEPAPLGQPMATQPLEPLRVLSDQRSAPHADVVRQESRTEPRPVTREEPRMEPRTDIHTEPGVQPRAEPRPVQRTEIVRQESRAEPRPIARDEPRIEPRVEIVSEPNLLPRMEPRPVPKTEIRAAARPELRSEPQSVPHLEPRQAETRVNPIADQGLEPRVVPRVDPSNVLPPPKVDAPVPRSDTVSIAAARAPEVATPAPLPVPTTRPAVIKQPPDADALAREDRLLVSYTQDLKRKVDEQKRYPKRALEAGWQGITKVRVHLAADGSVMDVGVEEKSEHSVLDEAALKMVKNLRPFPPLPEALRGKERTIIVPIQFLIAKS